VLGEGCRHEIVDGEVYELSPANEDHGTEHFDLPGLLKSCLAPTYKGTVDMLTRPKTASNHAPDVSILRRERDEKTGGRQVEDLIFEVIDTESLAHVTTKTRALVARGVRRAFLVDVKDRSIHEWSRDDDGWRKFADDALITDPCFVLPIPAKALVDDLLGDDTVARSLIKRGNRVLAAELRSAHAEGAHAGRAEGLLPMIHLLQRRMQRALTLAEREVLSHRFSAQGPDAVGDAALDRTPDALAAWLADPAAP
jgi:Uma2 family endonuclease